MEASERRTTPPHLFRHSRFDGGSPPGQLSAVADRAPPGVPASSPMEPPTARSIQRRRRRFPARSAVYVVPERRRRTPAVVRRRSTARFIVQEPQSPTPFCCPHVWCTKPPLGRRGRRIRAPPRGAIAVKPGTRRMAAWQMQSPFRREAQPEDDEDEDPRARRRWFFLVAKMFSRGASSPCVTGT